MLEASRAACAVSRMSATSRRKAGVAAGAEAAGVSPASIDGLEYCDRDPGVIPHSHTHCNCPARFGQGPEPYTSIPPNLSGRGRARIAHCVYVHLGAGLCHEQLC